MNAKEMIEYLESNNITTSYIERSLELPSGTVSHWKEGYVTIEDMNLLAIIKLYPWILEVADHDCNKQYAIEKLLQQVKISAKEERA